MRRFLWTTPLGIGILGFGAVTLLAHEDLMQRPHPVVFAVFLVAGGLTVALLGLAWRAASPDRPDWRLALIVLLVLLFSVFVWPTPYTYRQVGYRGEITLRINRVTGSVVVIDPERTR